MGLFLGQVVVEYHRDGGKPMDIYGSQVSMAARIMSMARGGQILCGRSVFDNARANLTNTTLDGVGKLKWLLHGSYRLKGLRLPQEIGEVGEKKHARFTRPMGRRATLRLPWLIAGAAFVVAVAAIVWSSLCVSTPIPVYTPKSEAPARPNIDTAQAEGVPTQQRPPESADSQPGTKGSTEKPVAVMEVVDKNRRESAAAGKMKETLLDIDFPGCMLSARIDAVAAKVVKQNGDFATVQWPVLISVNEEPYFNEVLPKLKAVLEGAVQSASEVFLNAKKTDDGHLVDAFQEERGEGHILPKNTVGIVVKKNGGGSNLSVNMLTLSGDAFAVLFRWLRSPYGEFTALPKLRIEWLDGNGNAILEDEIDLNRQSKGFYASPFMLDNGVQNGYFGWTMTGSVDDGIELGPFLYAFTGMSFVHCSGIWCSYKRDMPIEQLRQVTQIKCFLLGRSGETQSK
jgi:hypothetical protein